MPLPLTTTLLVSAFVAALLHYHTGAGAAVVLACANELLRIFVANNRVPPDDGTYQIPAQRQPTPIGPRDDG